MKHLPFNHNWMVSSWLYGTEYNDIMSLTFHGTTLLREFCTCGKVRTKKIADYPMTTEALERYIAEVYT